MYTPLTKKITDANGNEIAVCRFSGTEKCSALNTSHQCANCPMFANIITMLNTFEEIYLQGESNDSE